MMVIINEGGFQEVPTEAVAARFKTINDRRTNSGGIAGGTLR